MGIDEAREAKRQLESEILQAIAKFEHETKLFVETVYVDVREDIRMVTAKVNLN
ncbi:MAG TPA: hypothetical protein VF622_11745 [Segetibacter sp.]|jgi:hypothetical protein